MPMICLPICNFLGARAARLQDQIGGERAEIEDEEHRGWSGFGGCVGVAGERLRMNLHSRTRRIKLTCWPLTEFGGSWAIYTEFESISMHASPKTAIFL